MSALTSMQAANVGSTNTNPNAPAASQPGTPMAPLPSHSDLGAGKHAPLPPGHAVKPNIHNPKKSK